MKVTLVYPNLIFARKQASFAMKGYDHNMRGYPPLSLAYVAAILKRAGHTVHIIDANIWGLDTMEVIRRIKELSSDLIGFTVTTATFHQVCHWIRSVKAAVNIPVILGGVLLELYPEEVMSHGEIDYALIGMGTHSLSSFMKALRGEVSFDAVPGLCFRQNKDVIINQPQKDLLADLPFPSRELLSNHKYFSPFTFRKNFTTLVTTRGCPFTCAYCSLSRELQFRNIENVMAEVEECYHRFHIRDVDIYDALFTFDKERVMQFCQEIRRRKLKMQWMARAHIDSVDKEMIREMAQSGCRMLMYGIESVVPDILRRMNRRVVPLKKIQETILLTRQQGISPLGFFMLGAPGETKETMEETIRFAQKSKLDFAQFAKLTLIPRTRLYEEYKHHQRYDYWSEYIRDEHTRCVFPEVETRVSHQEIERYVKKGNRRFYVCFSRIWRMVSRIRSLRQIMHYVMSAIHLFGYRGKK